ncbi:RidA family protein [Streptomyces phaeolivaceus]|uniref:RidA family protein n=1 Tax=Streptomyces phaeolivaceus TaxID=2653200 RepID=A0A5P8KEA4_9ACTN|nr:Rid family hydrolase [Streptomyces phaeolivaceus]QFR01664.1 RidA family protein [Streptomyces phaeolivaceus]
MSDAVDWHAVMGFRPVVRKGPLVAVSGVGGRRDADGEFVDGDTYAQTVAALRKIERSLASVGAGVRHVVHTRVYLRNAEDWPLAGRAHGEMFATGDVALTMVEAKLVDPEMLVELDVLAWLPES